MIFENLNQIPSFNDNNNRSGYTGITALELEKKGIPSIILSW